MYYSYFELNLNTIYHKFQMEKDLIVNPLNPPETFSNFIHVILANKLKDNNFITYLIKVVLISKIDTIYKKIVEIYIKYCYDLMYKKYIELRKTISYHHEIMCRFNINSIRYEKIIRYLINGETGILINYVYENNKLNPIIEYVNHRLSLNEMDLLFTGSGKTINIQCKSNTMNETDMQNKLIKLIDNDFDVINQNELSVI